MKLFPLAAMLLVAHAAHGQDSAAVAGQINGMYPQLETIYKDLHQHPEIAFQEVRTAAKLAG